MIVVDVNRQPKKRLTFYDIFQPVYTISRVFGLSTFNIIFDAKGNIDRSSVNVTSVFLLASAIAINASLAYITQYSSRSAMSFESPIIYLADRTFRVISYMILFSSIALDMVNRNRVLKVVQDFILFDKVVRNIQ